MENNNEKGQMVKDSAKLALKAATAPIKTMIWGAVATILPYILVGLFIFIVIFCVYFGTLEQIDQIIDDSEDWGERLGHAVSLYGFKTTEEVEKTEEGKYFFMLKLYQKVFKFDNYEISLINKTLLYEGSSEERIYLSEVPSDYDEENPNDYDTNRNGNTDIMQDNDEGSGSSTKIGSFWEFIKTIITNFQRGFSTSYAGASQYLKANKNMLINATALRKCKNLTSNNREKVEQCYKGYLIAEYNIVTDYFVDCKYGKVLFCDIDKALETDVEPGFLVLPNNIIGETAGITNEILDIRNDITEILTKFSLAGGVIKRFNDFEETMRDTLTLFIFGTLAGEDAIHFYYDGYIVNNLKEEYKVYNNICYDNETCNEAGDSKISLLEKFERLVMAYNQDTIIQERKNRRETADMIKDLTETYFDLTYGLDKIEEIFTEIVASNEKNASVIIDADGNSISFDDYVLMYALAKYGDQIKEIVESGENVEERLRALMVLVRTQVYDDTDFNHSSAETTGNFAIYEDGKAVYDSFKADSRLHKYLASLSEAIAGSRGRTIKVNGQVVTLTPDQINQVLDAVENGGTIEDAIGNVIPDASLNVTFSPLPEGSFYVSSQYGEVRGDDTHNAIDYAAPAGTPIYSISDGVVADVANWCTEGDRNCAGGFGNRVYVRYTNGDGNNYYVIYAHMSSTANISVGQTISAGTLLGYVGNTGDSYGNHLHLEIRTNGTGTDAKTENPGTFFNY